MRLLKNATVVLPQSEFSDASVLLENGIIKAVLSNSASATISADETIDLDGARLFAGFIDIHNHGAVGVDTNEATAEDFLKASKFLAQNGVTAWLPTFVPDSDENYQRQIGTLENVRKTQENEAFAQIVGVHYEGVFANTQMCGALRPQFFKTFKYYNEINGLPRLKNAVHFTTLAPEIENGIELIKELVKQNWICSIGHTKAEIETLDAALEAGAKHLTHFFNAMSGIHHREIGVAGWGLTNENVTFDIIADGIHVAKPMLEFACRTKTPEKVALISDSVSPTGLGDGDFEIWGEKVSVTDGKTRNERGSIAGSVITMLDAVRNMLKLGFSASEVSQMASANPAKLLGIEKNYGSIEIGKRADLVALDENGEVKLCLVGGKIVG